MSNLGNKEIMAKNIRYYMDKYDKMTNVNHIYLCKMNTLLYIC